jgi:hypothetical protein
MAVPPLQWRREHCIRSQLRAGVQTSGCEMQSHLHSGTSLPEQFPDVTSFRSCCGGAQGGQRHAMCQELKFHTHLLCR